MLFYLLLKTVPFSLTAMKICPCLVITTCNVNEHCGLRKQDACLILGRSYATTEPRPVKKFTGTKAGSFSSVTPRVTLSLNPRQ